MPQNFMLIIYNYIVRPIHWSVNAHMLYNIKEFIFKNQLNSQNSEIITLTDIIALLNQAHADHRLAYIWFF